MSLTGPIQIFASDPYTENSATPNHVIGTKAYTPDGRVFRYARAGASALVIANLQVSPTTTTNHEDNAFATAGAAGDSTVSITVGATAVAANEYDDGYLVIIDDTGEGRVHRVVSHGASTAGGEAVSFQIQPGLQAATTTSTTVTLVRNPYNAVVIATAGTQDSRPAGVTVRAVTAAYYCWLQTGGIASILSSGTNTPAAGEAITIGEATNGSVSQRDAVGEAIVGYNLPGVGGTSAEHNPYFLSIDN